MSSLVILTGASGSGKTTLARAIEDLHLPRCEVFYFDSIGVPSGEAMSSYGTNHQPGGAWQRAMTIQWMERIAGALNGGASILLDGQMRIAFIREALQLTGIECAHIFLVDCDDVTRTKRLHKDRNQPELADAKMMSWARYLREEAKQYGCEILDTGTVPFSECCDRVVHLLTGS